VKMETLGNHK